MMKKFLERIARILAPALLASLVLAGCTSAEVLDYEPTEAPSPSVTAAPDGEVYQATDYRAAFEAYDADEVVMTINGIDVTWSEYFYWMVSVVKSFEDNGMGITDWAALNIADSTQTNSEYVKAYSLDAASQYRALEYNAAQMGVTLSEENIEALEEQWLVDVEYYGGGDEDAFGEFLDGLYISRELYDYMNSISMLYYNCYAEIYGENGELCTDEQALDFAEANSYIAAKHILISTVDDEGAALPEDELAERLALAEDLLAQLEAAEDKNARFDELMNEYSEDPGLLYYPDGYVFTTGEMAAAFEEAAFALEEGGISGIVDTTYGHHIIMRIPLNPDGVIEYSSEEEQYTLRYAAASSLFSATVGNWIEEAKADVKWLADFESLDLAALFAK